MKRIIDISEKDWNDVQQDKANMPSGMGLYETVIANSTPLNECETEDCITKKDALRVAKNEYLRGWHDALCKALSEKYSIHCEEGNFSVIQEETITGLGLSMDCALGKDVESYMNTIPSVTPQEPFINKPCVSEKVCEHDKQMVLDKIKENFIARYPRNYAGGLELGGRSCVFSLNDILHTIDKYKAESEDNNE